MKSLDFPGMLDSFGDIREEDSRTLRQPYIAVFYLDIKSDLYTKHGMKFLAKLYDGPFYTGYHRVTETVNEIYEDIEKQYPELKKTSPGAGDSADLLCVYM